MPLRHLEFYHINATHIRNVNRCDQSRMPINLFCGLHILCLCKIFNSLNIDSFISNSLFLALLIDYIINKRIDYHNGFPHYLIIRSDNPYIILHSCRYSSHRYGICYSGQRSADCWYIHGFFPGLGVFFSRHIQTQLHG